MSIEEIILYTVYGVIFALGTLFVGTRNNEIPPIAQKLIDTANANKAKKAKEMADKVTANEEQGHKKAPK